MRDTQNIVSWLQDIEYNISERKPLNRMQMQLLMQFIKKTKERYIAACMRNIYPVADREDLIQDVFVAIYRNFQRPSDTLIYAINKSGLDGQDLQRFIGGIAGNHRLMYWRRTKRRDINKIEEDLKLLYGNDPSNKDDKLVFDRMMEIGVLSELEVKVLFYRYICGFTLLECALLIDVKEDNVDDSNAITKVRRIQKAAEHKVKKFVQGSI